MNREQIYKAALEKIRDHMRRYSYGSFTTETMCTAALEAAAKAVDAPPRHAKHCRSTGPYSPVLSCCLGENEDVAEAIYRHSGGLDDDDYLVAMGKPRRQWKTGAEWDMNPDELAEHERDDYRLMARAAIDAYLRGAR